MSLQPINSPTTWKRAQTSINANFTALVNALAGEGTVDATDPAVTALLTDDGSGAYAAVEGIVEDVADDVVEDLVTSPSATRTALDAQYGGRVEIAKRPVTMADREGIDFTGVSDSSAAWAAALAEAGPGTRIDLGRPGRIRLDEGFTVPASSTLAGLTKHTGAGPTATTELVFGNLGNGDVGVTLGDSASIRDILLRGPGSGVAGVVGLTNTNSSVTLERVQLMSWAKGMVWEDVYYGKAIDCEWRWNAVGLELEHCYNVNLISPKFTCSDEAGTTMGRGVVATTSVSSLSVFGGSFERFGNVSNPAVWLAEGSGANFFGTYFESSATPGGFGIITSANVSLVLMGCTVILDEMNRWVHVDSGGGMVFSRGNVLRSTSGSSTTPIVYVIPAGSVSDVQDNLTSFAKGTYQSLSNPRAGANVQVPGSNDRMIGHGLALPQGRGITLWEDGANDHPAPGTNRGTLFMRDNGAGKTQLCVRFNTGAVQVIATEP